MMNANSSNAGYSWLFWSLGAIVAGLAFHVCTQWIRQATIHTVWRHRWPMLLVAGIALGTGLCSAMVMSVAGAALEFPVGYSAAGAAGLWVASSLASFAVAATIARNQQPLALQASGGLLGVVASAVQAGWISAAGFRPGAEWQPEWLVGAVALQISGFGLGLWIAFSPRSHDRTVRTIRAVSALGVIMLATFAAQQFMLEAANLAKQVGSVYGENLPGWVLSLAGGALVPLVLAFMAVEMTVRTYRRRRHRNYIRQV